MKIILSCLAILTSLMLTSCAGPDRAAATRDLTRDMIRQGVELRKQGKYEEAIQIFTEAIKVNPQNAVLYLQRADTYRMAKKSDLAISDYSQALSMSPKVPGAYYARGLAYGGKGSYNEAIQDFSQVIAMQPRAYNAYFFRGMTYLHKNQIEDAVNDFNQAIKLKPDDYKSYYYKGIAAEKLQQPGEALACYKTFLQYAPSKESQKIQSANQKITALNTLLDKPAKPIIPSPPALDQGVVATPEEPEDEPEDEPVQKARRPVRKKVRKPAAAKVEAKKPAEPAERVDQKEMFSAPLGEEAF